MQGTIQSNDPDNTALGQLNLPVLTCPDDDSAWQKPGGLSYVINSGYAGIDNLDAYMAAINGGGNPSETQMHNWTALPFDWDEDGNSPGARRLRFPIRQMRTSRKPAECPGFRFETKT